jgi:Ca-activated chloride channel family protein
MEFEYCTRCQINTPGEFLRELAYSKNRSLRDILKRAQQKQDSYLHRVSSEHATQRQREDVARLQQYESELRQLEENAAYDALDKIMQGKEIDEIVLLMLTDEARKSLEEKINALKWKPQDMSEDDVRQALREYERQGYIEIHEGSVRITSKGAKRLASNALQRILQSLGRKEVGAHSIEEMGFGSEVSAYTRHYEAGDDYSSVNIEKTAINALERSGRLKLELDDFEVHEEVHQSRLCAGLIIDESGSMRSNHKLEAAIDTALALSELMAREPEDSLRIFVFSDRVEEIPAWALVNDVLSSGSTDIRAALRTFRNNVRTETGDRQAYLITDTDPNTEDGRFVGFEKAAVGVIEEALCYRQDGVGLNIIMMDETPHLKLLASALARKNLGKVFFTSPHKLGQVIVEDYLRTKKERL